MRKEVELDKENEIFWLQAAADKKKWSLKKYMEYVLQVDAARIKHRTQVSSLDTPRKTEKSQVSR